MVMSFAFLASWAARFSVGGSDLTKEEDNTLVYVSSDLRYSDGTNGVRLAKKIYVINNADNNGMVWIYDTSTSSHPLVIGGMISCFHVAFIGSRFAR